jgi:positive regulator of sigma E activity
LHFYLLPLAFLLLATGIATMLELSEPVVMWVAAFALVSGFLCLPAGTCKQVAWRPVHVSMNTLECPIPKPNPKP